MATARSHTARNVGRRNEPALADRGRRAPNSFEGTAPNTGELNRRKKDSFGVAPDPADRVPESWQRALEGSGAAR